MEINRECPVCGLIYKANIIRLKHGRQTTCSRDCSYLLRANKLKNSIELTCATCGKKFSRCVSKINGKYGSQFCSRVCHYKGRSLGHSKRIIKKPYNITDKSRAGWRKGAKKTRETRKRRNNYGHSDATKAKISKSTIRAIAEGRVNTISKLEKKIIPILDSMGISYIHQFPVRDKLGRFRCVFDFFIPINKTVIEVNGTFYHFDIRFYPDGPVHPIQKRNALAWDRKIKVIDDLGYDLVELWEEDIKKRGQKYIRQAISSIG